MKINVIQNMKINPFLFIQMLLLIIFVLVPIVKTAPFCSIGCNPTSCNSLSSTSCTACSTYFKAPGAFPNSCDYDTTLAGVVLAKSTADFSVSPNPGVTCGAIAYNFGEYGNNAAVTIKSLSPISQNHYQVELLIWIILFDNWSSGYVDFKLVGSGQNHSISKLDQVLSGGYCFGGNSDGFVRFDSVYTHSDTASNIQFFMSSITPSLYGLRDILLIAKYCHYYCKICTGPASTVCSDCTTGNFLSSTECAPDCLPGYGKNLPSNICITCNAYCLTCVTSSTNCLTCRDTVSGTQVYKVQDQNSCLATCSAGYYSHLSSKKCLLCSLHCVNISITGQLVSGNTALQFIYTFTEAMVFTSFNYATFLNFSSDNASINANTDFNVLYTAIDITHFKLTLTPKPGKYLVNTQICTNILPQAGNPYQYSQALNKLSPSVYTSTNCVIWSTPQAGMTISSQVDPSQTFGEFFFTFTDTMSFGAFIYSNFTFFNTTNSSLNMINDFIITYTVINSTSFKLKLAPKPMVYFTGATFCAITYPEGSTTLQFSANNMKLNSLVYNAYSCITFSTPKVNMTITNQLDSSLKFLEFIFTFTADMDFTGFLYNDFALLNQSDSLLNLATDFTVLYTEVNLTTFKLKITPNLGIYFASTTFCTVSQAQTLTALQFSQAFYKLDPTVYGKQSCVIWTIPSVNMTVSSQILDSGKNAQFVFTFDAPMNFNSFSYTDFLNFALNTAELNFSADFTVNYTQIDQYSFKLQLTPLQQVEFKNLDFCTISKQRLSTLLQLSNDNTALSPSVYNQKNCILWSTPIPSIFTPDQQIYYKNLQIFNNHFEQITTKKGAQQIIKSGVFALFMPGAQLSTTVLLHQPRIAQNLYEGSRFWGSFVFFDVPPYGQSSNKTKYTFSQTDKQIIQKSKTRRLQQSNSGNFINEWKFDRTGHTGFFIFDTYIQMIMIALSWILCLIVLVYKKKCQPKAVTLWKLKARVMAFFHKVHEISFFYLVLSGLIEYKNLDTSNYLHTFSMVIASVFLFYYLTYQLKVFYDFIDYPRAKIGTREYQTFVQNYGIYIAYYRFEEYNDKKTWSWRHFLRPYNYHTVTFIKKALMLTAVPLFYDHGLWPVLILTILQGLDVVRFLLTLPYHSIFRNVFYFFLEGLLFTFFVSSFINQSVGSSIYDSNGVIVDITNATIYKNSGWIGMIVLFMYNILYILSNFVEFGILLFRKSSIENLVWSNRNSYYEQLYEHFQQYGSYYRLVKNYTDELAYNTQRREANSFKGWVNKLHRAQPLVDLSDSKLKVFKEIYERGNLFTTQFDQNMTNQWVDEKIQIFKIKDFQRIIRLSNFHKGQFAPKHQDQFIKHETQSSSPYKKSQKSKLQTKSMRNLLSLKDDQPMLNFDIQYEIIPQIYVADPLRHKQTKKNLYIPKKIKNSICTYDLNPHFQKNLVMTLISYQMPGTDQIKLSTILRVNLKNHEQGQKVIFKRQDMRQQITIKRGRKSHKIQLKQLIQGFPTDLSSLQKTQQKQQSLNEEINKKNAILLRIEV